MGAELYDLPRIVDTRVSSVTFEDATMASQSRDPGSDVSRANLPAKHLIKSMRCQQDASRAATVCCVSTRWAARSFEQDYGIPADKIVVVGMGHRPRLAAGSQNRDWSMPRFLFVGADWQQKNGPAVLEAFDVVREQVPAATLHLVGAHPPMTRPGVTTHGFLPRQAASAQLLLDRLYATATCFVLPSLFDAAGIAYLEAASAGLPVVATARGGAPEMLMDGAVVVDPQDRSALVQAMLTLSDPDTARSMGAVARRNTASSSWREVAGRILEALASRTGHGARVPALPRGDS
jgi:glycosyltransferase involved in cell wall biosynthesis